jgi:RHS repeat-associated protein
LVEPDPGNPSRLRLRFDAEVPFEATARGDRCRRPLQWLRTLYRRDDLTGLLPLGELHPLGLHGEGYRLAFSPGLLTQVFQRDGRALLPDPSAVLGGQAGDQGGYLQSQALKADGLFPVGDADDHWWIGSGRSFFTANPTEDAAVELAGARRHFFLPRRYQDQFGHSAVVDYDPNDLLMVESRDALGNRISVDALDYRVLQPRVISDPNRNRTEVAFDALGMVVGTAVMGKPSPAPAEGDSLDGFAAELTQAELDAFFGAEDPRDGALALLKDATTRVVYDLDRFRRSQRANPNNPAAWQPAYSATIARETHALDPLPPQGLRLQLSFGYSDGFGRGIQTKMPAEPGPVVDDGPVVASRWVGSGWTIFNNKGKPVRQFEPYFSVTHRFDFGLTAGVSPVLFYDPVERVIATLHPNHAYEKVVFDPWQQTTYDVNDTCAPRNAETGDPRTDPDIASHVREYFRIQPATWQTWREQRIGGALGQHERTAATRAAAHADTPVTAHVDALGRPFLTEERNRTICAGHDLDGLEERLQSRVELDIEGNQRTVRDPVTQVGDPFGRVVMRYAYDLLGNRIQQLSMDAGTLWVLNDATGKPIRVWDSRGHAFTTTYDQLRRPLEQTVRGTTAESDPRTLDQDVLVDRIEYAEGQPSSESLNLRTRIYRHFDAAGVVISARLDADGNPVRAYDFKGNLLHSTRRLLSDGTTIPDWRLNPQLDAERFEASDRYDALNRVTQSVAPHSSAGPTTRNVLQQVFNEANLLDRVDVWLEREAEPDGLIDPGREAPSPVGVADIDYDARGQRLKIEYKNGVATRYAYDVETLRLAHLHTGPPRKASGLQSLHYTYDPAGNITHIQDDAQQSIFFRNRRVEPSSDYTYDAVYQLVQATGREHLGQVNGVPNPPTSADGFNTFHTRLQHPGDGGAMGRYVERYVYDAGGNLLKLQHRGSDPAHAGWTRAYDYEETSLIEDGTGGVAVKTSNRLTRTTANPNGANPPQVELYQHDAHGNMVRMPHLGGGQPGSNLHWNYKDQVCRTDLGGGGTAHYAYDASGQRVRKVWEKSPGLTEERIYLGGLEIFRRHGGPIGPSTVTLERETLHVTDDKQRVALVESRTLDRSGDDPAPARSVRYQLGDHLGSASLELDDQAQILSYEEYAPYGSSTYQAMRGQTEAPKRYRFTGKERDEESGLSYHGARYYAPWLGRWTSADPAGLIDGLNRYAYARNSPTTRVDSDGRQSDFIREIENALDNLTTGAYRRFKAKLNLDEIDAVKGHKAGGVAGSPSDSANKQILENKTNSASKGNKVGPAPHRRPPVSFANDPKAAANRTLTGPLDEVDEIRRHADDATRAVRQGLRTNASLWRRLRANPTISRALELIGVDLQSGTLFNPPGVQQFPQSGSVNLSPRDADLDPRTGQVVDGPNTRAAVARQEARQAASTVTSEVKAATSAEARAASNAVVSATRGEAGLVARLGGWTGVVFKGVVVLNVYLAYDAYQEGVNAKTIVPAGPAGGLSVGSEGEGILNAAGSFLGAPQYGTMLREAAQLGSTGIDPGELWDAARSGASPVSIGMGIAFGAFR